MNKIDSMTGKYPSSPTLKPHISSSSVREESDDNCVLRFKNYTVHTLHGPIINIVRYRETMGRLKETVCRKKSKHLPKDVILIHDDATPDINNLAK